MLHFIKHDSDLLLLTLLNEDILGTLDVVIYSRMHFIVFLLLLNFNWLLLLLLGLMFSSRLCTMIAEQVSDILIRCQFTRSQALFVSHLQTFLAKWKDKFDQIRVVSIGEAS